MGEGLLVAGRVEGVGLDLPEVDLVLVVLLDPVSHPLRAMHNFILLFIDHLPSPSHPPTPSLNSCNLILSCSKNFDDKTNQVCLFRAASLSFMNSGPTTFLKT